jgi:hypothetical protein
METLSDSGHYGILFMIVCCYSRCHGNVKWFCALWDNIYDCACLLLYTFHVILKARFTGKENNIFNTPLSLTAENYNRVSLSMTPA